jgi:hypothetical protein
MFQNVIIVILMVLVFRRELKDFKKYKQTVFITKLRSAVQRMVNESYLREDLNILGKGLLNVPRMTIKKNVGMFKLKIERVNIFWANIFLDINLNMTYSHSNDSIEEDYRFKTKRVFIGRINLLNFKYETENKPTENLNVMVHDILLSTVHKTEPFLIRIQKMQDFYHLMEVIR